MKRFAAALVALFFVLLAPPVYADDAEAARSWFDQSATAALRAHAKEQFADIETSKLSEIDVGEPRQASQFVGRTTSLTASNMWIATLRFNDVLIGTIAVPMKSGIAGDPQFTRSLDVVQAVENHAENHEIVYDAMIGGWFVVEKDRVHAVGSAATDVLAGTVTLSQFDAIRTSLTKTTPTPVASVRESGGALPIAIAAVVVLLLVVGVVVWVRYDVHQSDEEDSSSEQSAIRSTGKVRILERPVKNEGDAA